MSSLFDPRYWFDLVPGTPNLLFWKIVFGGAVVVVLFAIVATVMARRYKRDGVRHKIWYKFAVWGYSVSVVVGILGFFRFQDAYFLSMRLWIFLWLGISFIWLIWILRYVFFIAPKRLKAREEKRAYEQYLPGQR